MIIDTSFIEPLYQAEKRKSYKDLLSYMIDLNFDENFYKKIGIYYEEYSYKNNTLYVPLSILFLLNYLNGAFVKARNIANRPEFGVIKNYFLKELEDCNKLKKQKLTYNDLYGNKADLVKKKISVSMSNLDKKIIEKRNKSISNYASNRPKYHNNNISLGRQKKVIDTVTGEVYNTAKEASLATGICLSYIRQSCQGKRQPSFRYQTK